MKEHLQMRSQKFSTMSQTVLPRSQTLQSKLRSQYELKQFSLYLPITNYFSCDPNSFDFH